DGVRLRAQGRRDDAAAVAPAERRRGGAQDSFRRRPIGEDAQGEQIRRRDRGGAVPLDAVAPGDGRGEGGGAEGPRRRRPPRGGDARPLLGAAQLEGVLVQSLISYHLPRTTRT